MAILLQLLTNFHGMDLTQIAITDKLRFMVKKWQTLIEANVDVKTTDGYLLRVFCIGFTNKDQLSTRGTCYLLTVSRIVLYQEHLYDLLTDEQRNQYIVDIRNDSKDIKTSGLLDNETKNAIEALNCLTQRSFGNSGSPSL